MVSQNMRVAAEWCVRSLTSWNLADPERGDLPINAESLLSFGDYDLILRIADEMAKDISRLASELTNRN
jgi:hypothetical protein